MTNARRHAEAGTPGTPAPRARPRRAHPSVPPCTLALVFLLLMGSAAGAAAQSAGESVMVAAGEWALERLPGGEPRLDPHRTAASGDMIGRVARALGARLATLEQTRSCRDVMDPASCEVVAPILALTEPAIQGDRARIRVYAWYDGDSPREPVAERAWDLLLSRSGSGWQVVSAN